MLNLLRKLNAFIIALVEILLIVRFVLKMMVANPQAPIASWVYETSLPLLNPFLALFPNSTSLRGGVVLEFATLFAIFAYAFIGYIIQQLLELGGRKKKHRPVYEDGQDAADE